MIPAQVLWSPPAARELRECVVRAGQAVGAGHWLKWLKAQVGVPLEMVL